VPTAVCVPSPPVSWGRIVILLVFVAQAASALFFISDIVLSVFGLYPRPISWQTREYLELGAAAGLVLGMTTGAALVVRSVRDRRRAEERLRRAAGAFLDLVNDRLEEWGLTPAERDVALFALKGLSTAEIARLRGTSEGTVKAQTAAIYRKAGVGGRPQFLSLFIEDLMSGLPAQSAPAPAPVGAAGPADQPPV